MSLVSIIVLLIIAGVVAWLIGKAPFIDEPYKSFAKYAILVVVVIYILLGVLGPMPDIRIHR